MVQITAWLRAAYFGSALEAEETVRWLSDNDALLETIEIWCEEDRVFHGFDLPLANVL